MGTKRLAQTIHMPGLMGLLLISACSTSPMRARLDKNFVYNCTLELVDKGVKALEAEKVCVSSHQAEMLEEDRRMGTLRTPANNSRPNPAIAQPRQAPAAQVPGSPPSTTDSVAPTAYAKEETLNPDSAPANSEATREPASAKPSTEENP